MNPITRLRKLWAATRARRRSLVIAMEAWLREQRAKLSGQSKVAKAIAYSLTRWAALTRFLGDGRLCMSNNAAKRTTTEPSPDPTKAAAAPHAEVACPGAAPEAD